MKRYALIVAGGSGTRMGSEIPKQFLKIGGIPILFRTITVFEKLELQPEIILVLPVNQHEYWKKLCVDLDFSNNHRIAPGGPTRFASVKNGLDFIDNDNSLVAIHDGVRPFVSPSVIETCYQTAAEFGSAVPVINPLDSIRVSDGYRFLQKSRKDVFLVQTPQAFQTKVIKKCYSVSFQNHFTDDSSVAEFSGVELRFVKGNYENIKITNPLDLKISESLIDY